MDLGFTGIDLGPKSYDFPGGPATQERLPSPPCRGAGGSELHEKGGAEPAGRGLRIGQQKRPRYEVVGRCVALKAVAPLSPSCKVMKHLPPYRCAHPWSRSTSSPYSPSAQVPLHVGSSEPCGSSERPGAPIGSAPGAGLGLVLKPRRLCAKATAYFAAAETLLSSSVSLSAWNSTRALVVADLLAPSFAAFEALGEQNLDNCEPGARLFASFFGRFLVVATCFLDQNKSTKSKRRAISERCPEAPPARHGAAKRLRQGFKGSIRLSGRSFAVFAGRTSRCITRCSPPGSSKCILEPRSEP